MAEVDQNAENPEEIITLSEVIKREQDLQNDVYAVLGGSNDKNCSYSEGYVKRQALYACLTCMPEAKDDPSKRAGVCLACCYQCHDGHDLIELFTKRCFRCDCGNKKFGDNKCNLCDNKGDYNEQNAYNQNFTGVYCTCSRPYPDPDDPVQDEMIQCIMCEDWYHTRHLDAKIPKNFAEMICGICVKLHPFILNYEGSTLSHVVPSSDDDVSSIDVTCEKADKAGTNPSTNPTPETEIKDKDPNADIKDCIKPKLSLESVACAKFFANENWRKQLCKCESCMNMYEEQKVSFLTDMQDTVQCYEAKGNAKAVENEEMQIKLINELPRVPLLETIFAYNDLKKNLSEYLQKFAENKKVVREEDIKEFFAEMDARKKQKVD